MKLIKILIFSSVGPACRKLAPVPAPIFSYQIYLKTFKYFHGFKKFHYEIFIMKLNFKFLIEKVKGICSIFM
jgi:hypothetical protein